MYYYLHVDPRDFESLPLSLTPRTALFKISGESETLDLCAGAVLIADQMPRHSSIRNIYNPVSVNFFTHQLFQAFQEYRFLLICRRSYCHIILYPFLRPNGSRRPVRFATNVAKSR